jgi:hypothetical protein
MGERISRRVNGRQWRSVKRGVVQSADTAMNETTTITAAATAKSQGGIETLGDMK